MQNYQTKMPLFKFKDWIEEKYFSYLVKEKNDELDFLNKIMELKIKIQNKGIGYDFSEFGPVSRERNLAFEENKNQEINDKMKFLKTWIIHSKPYLQSGIAELDNKLTTAKAPLFLAWYPFYIDSARERFVPLFIGIEDLIKEHTQFILKDEEVYVEEKRG